MTMAGAEGLVGVWRGGERVDVLDPADRGFAYGDGLFETMRAQDGALPWWPRHRARLLAGARRLGLPFPADALLDAALAEALSNAPGGVVKLVLSRGAGARGYAPPSPEIGLAPTLVVSVSAPPARASVPLAIDALGLRLGVQPALAGLKHLNRLEQVLGAREAAERGLDEGLMADSEGRVTCGTRGNVFARIDGRWITPPVDRAGVAGIARGLLLEAWPALREGVLPLDELPRADALFLANAVRGILPAGRCGARTLDPRSEGLEDARAVLAASHPAFRES
jgi:4-amino-4-deoxychorismate lyase